MTGTLIPARNVYSEKKTNVLYSWSEIFVRMLTEVITDILLK